MQNAAGENRSGLFWGAIMVIVGVVILASQYLDMGWFWARIAIYIMPALGLGFMTLGVLKRDPGFIIPGGILMGLGTGIVLTATGMVGGVDSGGVFMLSFAMGFVLVTVATALFTRETHWWGLIPGSIMALVGLTVLYGGIFESGLILLGQLWPLALIAGGLYTIYRVRRHRQVL